MHSARSRVRGIRLSSECEAIEVRIATVEPDRGKDRDEVMTAVSATSWATVRSGSSLASCSSSSRATTGTAHRKVTFAEASTPSLKPRLRQSN